MEGFYLPPGPQFEPGDIFLDIPFPCLKYPLKFFRPSPKVENTADIFSPGQCAPKDTDTAKASFQCRTVMLLSHGCDLDGITREVAAGRTSFERRYWLAAPVQPIAETSDPMARRIRDGKQPNRFYLPDGRTPGDGEQFVDLRKITPINVPYFVDAASTGKRTATLTEPARLALQAHLGLFFSGLVLYVQPVPCPHCSAVIDPTTFIAPSGEED